MFKVTEINPIPPKKKPKATKDILLDGLKTLPSKSKVDSVLEDEYKKKQKESLQSNRKTIKNLIKERLEPKTNNASSVFTSTALRPSILNDDYDDETEAEARTSMMDSISEFSQRVHEEYDDDEYDDDGIIMRERGSYNKFKKDKNDYKKEFAEELTLLYGLLSESSKFSKTLEKKFDSLEGSKARVNSKYINDIAMTIISSKNSKLSILKEIANIKKTISDLKLKETRNTDEKSSMNNMASNYFQNVINHGRGKVVKALTTAYDSDGVEVSANETDDLGDSERDGIFEHIDNRLRAEPNIFRSEEGTKYIEMEHLGIKTIIEKNIDTGDWRFANVDRNNQRVEGYPLPRLDRNTKITFTDEGKFATDNINSRYEVFDLYGDMY